MYPLTVEGGFNMRDLGDYPTQDGRVLLSRKLIRSGNLADVTPSAQQYLIDYGVKTIIDLRDEWEVEQFPNPFAQSTAVRYLNLPLIGKTMSQADNPIWKVEAKNYTVLHELYAKYLDRCQNQIGTIVTTVAESTFAILFHCFAGKDRTGIITALLLSAMGVQDDIIAEDYALTGSQITHLVTLWRDDALQSGEDMQDFERDMGSNTDTMLGMLGYLKQQYGGAVNYLYRCGVSEGQLERLQTQCIQ
ncbi:MAG: protein-tyrosine-phosphatase [Chloroflexi bacterium]|nr:protein-tyrosine-phosphatase [Chloroflexota bacterium]